MKLLLLSEIICFVAAALFRLKSFIIVTLAVLRAHLLSCNIINLLFEQSISYFRYQTLPVLLGLNCVEVKLLDRIHVYLRQNERILDQIRIFSSCDKLFNEEKHFFWITKNRIIFNQLKIL